MRIDPGAHCRAADGQTLQARLAGADTLRRQFQGRALLDRYLRAFRLDLVLAESAALGIPPLLGVRVRLAAVAAITEVGIEAGDDAAARGIADGDLVRVFNARGACRARAASTRIAISASTSTSSPSATNGACRGIQN